jgi:2-keto-3-deoxy-L-rhamnonate aldolase RhmA
MNLRQKIRNKIPTLGTWITLYHRGIVEIACNSGLDWICIDLEHSSIDFDQAATLISIARSRAVPALVRLSSNDAVQIKRIMDAGAEGIIVPMVKTREEAIHAYKSLHYPPLGFRGVGLSTAQSYGASFQEYQEWQKSGPILIVQIEHIESVKNLESILALDEVDGYLVGPYDLSASMHIPGQFEHPDFKKVMESINAITSQIEKSSGIHLVEPDVEKLKEFVRLGYAFIAISFETRILDVFFRGAVSAFQKQKTVTGQPSA